MLAPALAFGVSAAVIAALARHPGIAPHDRPNERSLHEGVVPRAGGWAVVGGWLVAALVAGAPPAMSGASFAALLVALAALFAASLADDYRGVGAGWRIAIQFAGAALVAAALARDAHVGVAWGAATTLVIVAATNFYSFISLADAKRLLRAGDRVSYFLTQPKPGYSDEDVVAAIGRDLPGVSALTSARFADNSRDIIVKMIGRPLKTMIAIAVLVGTALIGLTMWSVTAEQMADFGILRALGVRPIQLSRIVIAQAAVVAACPARNNHVGTKRLMGALAVARPRVSHSFS